MMCPAFFKGSLATGRYQLEKALDGMSSEQCAMSPMTTLMSATQTMEHLCEAYVACEAALQHRTHEWGSYKTGITDSDALKAHMFELRDRVTEMVTESQDERAHALASDYLVQHDAYHIGQLCACRIALDPSFDAYAIYQGH